MQFFKRQVLRNRTAYTIIYLYQSGGDTNVRIRIYQKDWSLFREKISDWQEAYMDKLNKEYIELLNGEGTPSEKFWTLEERIRNDKKDTGVQLRMSRSNCISNIVSLLNEGAITMNALEEFSDELKENIRFITG
mgnify:CR=1 FL=1